MEAGFTSSLLLETAEVTDRFHPHTHRSACGFQDEYLMKMFPAHSVEMGKHGIVWGTGRPYLSKYRAA